MPLNYYQKDASEKNKITDAFLQLFRTCPANLHIKMRTEKADTNVIIRTIRENYKKENNAQLKIMAEHYIAHITALQNANTVDKRFYIIYQYEGENGRISRDFGEIYRSLKSIEYDLRSKMTSCGNLVITPKNENYHACEVLYKFYNPLSCKDECLQDRINRIQMDFNKTNNPIGLPREADYIAPRGLSSRPVKDWLLMDGMYHTWLVIRDNAFPPQAQTGWLDNIPVDYGIDIDIISKRLNRGTVEAGLKQMRKYKYSSFNAHRTNYDKAEALSKEIQNAEYIKSCMNKFDEDLFSCEIIITVRAETYALMRELKNSIQKHLEGFSVYTSTSFLSAHEWLKNVAPDMYVTKSYFRKFSHNMLTRNMAQLYPFTSMSLFDNEGYVVGRNVLGSSLVSFNNFNTQLYSNGNIVIMGTPGSGKSFLEMMLASRMRMMGVRTMFILPLKAHEYYNACEKMGGEYIKFIPGGKTCVNIMEIRPQVTVSGDLLEDADSADGMDAPLLARKIASLCAFLQLNMQDDKLSTSEKNRFNVLCTKLYANYGITSNNDSIWLNKAQRKLKPMPILQDLNDALKEDPVLSRVRDALSPYMYGGMFSNFNGPTNVDLTKQYLVFDVDKTSISEDYLPAMMYIAFDCCYDLAKQSLKHKDAIFMDEVWLMMQNEDCAKQVKEMVKIIRGYGSCTVLATQDIGDFLRSNDGLGESILAASKIKFFLRIEDMEINNVARVVDINANDRANFKKFPSHGRALLMSDKDKILIDLISSEEELKTYTTDVNLRKKFSEKTG
ncbi:VirB4 family type IV secretion system protein [Butyrivibrio sp. AC2005]|uniref:VirB4 family type IV secretion system protein n=1 Tax=Butyrivibrio sp. AC2005 TaxID=1280672 RepID=UPI0009DBF00D